MPNLRDRLYNSDAVILRRSNFGEADRLLTVFTADRGKLRLVAKGVRKTKSRKAGHVELFMHTSLQIAKGRTLDLITQADTVESFRALHEDLDKLSQAYYLAELIDQFTEETDASFPIFELILLTLARLNDGSLAEQFLALRYFELKLLHLTGYQPQLFFCVMSQAEIKPEDNFFSLSAGGVVAPTHAENSPNTVPLALNTLKVLRFLQTRPWADVAALQLTPTTAHDVERILLSYITYLLERNLKSISFLRKLRQQLPRHPAETASLN